METNPKPSVLSRPVKRPPKAVRADLSDEIKMLRAIMRRVTALVDEGRTLPELLRILDTIGKASAHVAGLLRTEQKLSDGAQTSAETLNRALAEVIRDMERER